MTLSGNQNITFKNGNLVIVEFTINASNVSINFSLLTIERVNVTTGSVLIKGLNVTNKTLYLSRTNTALTQVCIKDAERKLKIKLKETKDA